ncbi:MAG: hypothetical protein ACP5NQ_07350 [Vulcanisaeta sp.]
MKKNSLSLIISVTILLAINIYVFKREPMAIGIIGIILLLSSYIIVIVKHSVSWYLFFIDEAYTVLALSVIQGTIPNSLVLAILITASIIIYLSLNGSFNMRVLALSSVMLVTSIILTYILYSLLRGFIIMYIEIINANIIYFTLVLASSISIFILFLINLLIKELAHKVHLRK